MAECRESILRQGLHGRLWQRDANNTGGHQFFGSTSSVWLKAMDFLVARHVAPALSFSPNLRFAAHCVLVPVSNRACILLYVHFPF